MSFESFMRGVKLAEEEFQSKQQMQQRAEDRKLQQDILKHQIARLKIQDQLEQRAAATQQAKLMEGQPGQVVPDVGPENELPAVGDQPAVPLGGTKVLPHPAIPLQAIPEMGLPATSIQPQTLQELMHRQQMEAITASQQKIAEAAALEAEKNRYSFHSMTPGAPAIVGAGTPGQQVLDAPPVHEKPTLTTEDITVNGKGPVKAFLMKQGDTAKWLDATTLQPIQGTIGTYERPREGNPVLDALRLMTLQNQSVAAPGQIVFAATGKPVPPEKIGDTASARLSGFEDALAEADVVDQSLLSLGETGAIKGYVLREGVYWPVVQDKISGDQAAAVADVQRLINSYLYAVSGKQINEQEMGRIARTAPDIRFTKDANKKILGKFKEYIERSRDNYLRIRGWKYQDSSAPTAAPKQTGVGPNGNLWEKDATGWHDTGRKP